MAKSPKYDDKKKGKGLPTPPQLEKTRWQKGQSGNSKGRPPDGEALRMMKRLTKEELIEVGELVIMNNVAELKRLRKDDTCSVLKGMFVGVCLRIMRDGSMENFDRLISRFIGKVKDELDVTHTGEVKSRVVVMLPSNGREKETKP